MRRRIVAAAGVALAAAVLVLAGSSSASATAPSPITYDFNGSVQGWAALSGDTAKVITSPVHAGSGALSYAGTGGVGASGGVWSGNLLTSATTAAATVSVTGYLDVPSSGGSWYFCGGDPSAGFSCAAALSYTQGTYTQVSATLSIASGRSAWGLKLVNSASSTGYLDDVTMNVSPASQVLGTETNGTPSGTTTATPTPTPTPTPTASATPTATPTPTPSASSSAAGSGCASPCAVTSPSLDALVVVAEYGGAMGMVVLGLLTARLLRG